MEEDLVMIARAENEDLKVEINRLQKFKNLVYFIANDYHELSYDKSLWQRDDWKKRCRKLIQEEDDD